MAAPEKRDFSADFHFVTRGMAGADNSRKKRRRAKSAPSIDEDNPKAGRKASKKKKDAKSADLDPAERRRRADEVEHPNDEQKERMNRFISDVIAQGVDGLAREYEVEMKNYQTPDLRRSAYNKNLDKNRFKDVVCLDQTRVVLQGGGNDYIHANYVRGDPLINTFICTQGPLTNTVNDFWRMVVQERIGTIMMLCQLEEFGKKRCEQYWPAQLGQEKVCGAYTIRCTGVDIADRRITVTSLKILEKDKELFVVKHCHWGSWPDRAVPQSLLAAFRLLRLARNSRYPTAIHCAAGIGRTGTVVAIEMLLQSIIRQDNVRMPSVIKQLRGMRACAVQTEMQYVFLAVAICNYCKEVGIMKSEYFESFSKFKSSYEQMAREKNAEEEAKVRAAAIDIANCTPAPPPAEGAPAPAPPPPVPPATMPVGAGGAPPPMPEAAGTGFDIGLMATGNILGAGCVAGTGDKDKP